MLQTRIWWDQKELQINDSSDRISDYRRCEHVEYIIQNISPRQSWIMVHEKKEMMEDV
jgi:hypothetical protein